MQHDISKVWKIGKPKKKSAHSVGTLESSCRMLCSWPSVVVTWKAQVQDSGDIFGTDPRCYQVGGDLKSLLVDYYDIFGDYNIYIHSMRSSFYYPAEFQIRTIHSAGLGGGSWGSPVLCCLGTTMGCCCNQTELLQRLGTAGPWQLQEVPDPSRPVIPNSEPKRIKMHTVRVSFLYSYIL